MSWVFASRGRDRPRLLGRRSIDGGRPRPDGARVRRALNIACIGVGCKGDSDTDHAGKIGSVVGLCDIDDNSLDGKAKAFPKAKPFNDFRVLLEKMDKEIDSVVVSAPAHAPSRKICTTPNCKTPKKRENSLLL